MKKVVFAATGASGAGLFLKLVNAAKDSCEAHVIVSKNAMKVLEAEENLKLNLDELGVKIYDDQDLSAGPASGSFGTDAMIIAPCSTNTLAKVANGISDTLITRAASVALKERQTLVLGVREMPFSAIALSQMQLLSSLGAIIAPPVLGYYAGIKSLQDMENFIIGKWLDALKIKNNLYKRWQI
ncbi:UbiX family flavin prenyltransferase [Campylobacter concisus]|uniref:UbiX family flavin prenyltransferase n=1 Tax=Campylobacter concisus TaxID=199 RepID=UPI000CD90479|nr:UbiX family flavin prenyltransferase [Campylobacter concisus]